MAFVAGTSFVSDDVVQIDGKRTTAVQGDGLGLSGCHGLASSSPPSAHPTCLEPGWAPHPRVVTHRWWVQCRQIPRFLLARLSYLLLAAARGAPSSIGHDHERRAIIGRPKPSPVHRLRVQCGDDLGVWVECSQTQWSRGVWLRRRFGPSRSSESTGRFLWGKNKRCRIVPSHRGVSTPGSTSRASIPWVIPTITKRVLDKNTFKTYPYARTTNQDRDNLALLMDL